MLITKACPECNTKPETDAMIAQEDKSAYRNDAAPPRSAKPLTPCASSTA